MIHVMAGMPFDTGTVIVPPPGVSASAADFFEINVKGTGCRGSMPHTGADPLYAAANILIALEEINARELAMDDQAVLTIGSYPCRNSEKRHSRHCCYGWGYLDLR